MTQPAPPPGWPVHGSFAVIRAAAVAARFELDTPAG